MLIKSSENQFRCINIFANKTWCYLWCYQNNNQHSNRLLIGWFDVKLNNIKDYFLWISINGNQIICFYLESITQLKIIESNNLNGASLRWQISMNWTCHMIILMMYYQYDDHIEVMRIEKSISKINISFFKRLAFTMKF